MKTILLASVALTAVSALGASPAAAAGACVTKYAVATSGSADSAKWFALETTVQLVSWGLWPGFVATNKVEGYNVKDKYTCKPDGGAVTCNVAATFCPK